MLRYGFVLVISLLCVVTVAASEPGQPLDCDDWVFLEPGLFCQTVVPYPCPAGEDSPCLASYEHRVVDNQGGRLWVRRIFLDDVFCGNLGPGGSNGGLWRTELVRLTDAGEQVLGYLEDRCVDPSKNYADTQPSFSLFSLLGLGDPQTVDELSSLISFDPTNGRLFVTLRNKCLWGGGPGGTPCDYNPGLQLIAIEGLTTTFEILQTYEPQASNLGFRVPYMPEGFQYADWFDSYYGELPVDFTEAQGLDCGFPASPPSVGDYLTVADTLSTPEPGEGFWYVTAVNYQGQTRYGRQRMGGVLSGRDPAMFPACSD